MKKNYIITILVACLMATSFFSAEAEENPNLLLLNSNHFGKNPNYGANAVFSQYDEASSVMAPKRRKSKRRKGGRRGGSDIAFEKGTMGVDLGTGASLFGIIPGMSSKFIPLSLNAEYCFWSGTKSSFSVGIVGSYTSLEFSEQNINDQFGMGGFEEDSSNVAVKFSSFYAGGKIQYNYNFNSRVSYYVNLMIGYFGFSVEDESENVEDLGFTGASLTGVLPLSMMGFKFFFTENIGMHVEWGFDGAKVAGLGLSVKF